MYFVMLGILVVLIVGMKLREQKVRRIIQERQDQMLRLIEAVGMTESTSPVVRPESRPARPETMPMLANSAAVAVEGAETKRFSVGRILLGVTIALILFLIFRPYIVLLFTLGPVEFIRMLAL